MLRQPVFRYAAANEQSDDIDGALFAFVEGTDPEVLLLIEATKEGNGVWQFGLARTNRDTLQVTYRGDAIWSAPKIDDVMGREREPYAPFKLDEVARDAAQKERQLLT